MLRQIAGFSIAPAGVVSPTLFNDLPTGPPWAPPPPPKSLYLLWGRTAPRDFSR